MELFSVHGTTFPNQLTRQFQILDGGSEDWTKQHSSLTSDSSRLLLTPIISEAARRVQSYKDAGQRFPVRAERSRCHEAVFNRISPSLLDIFHDSRAVSHFLDEVPTSSSGWWDLKSSAVESHNFIKALLCFNNSGSCFSE